MSTKRIAVHKILQQQNENLAWTTFKACNYLTGCVWYNTQRINDRFKVSTLNYFCMAIKSTVYFLKAISFICWFKLAGKFNVKKCFKWTSPPFHPHPKSWLSYLVYILICFQVPPLQSMLRCFKDVSRCIKEESFGAVTMYQVNL